MKNYFVKIVAMTAMVFVATVQPRAQSGDKLYVYAPDGTSQVFVLDDLQKITFSESEINLIPVTGAVTSFAFEDVSVITFLEKPTSIQAVVKKSNVKLYVEADKLTIESDTDLTAVKLYNLQGQLLKDQTAQSPSTTISLASCPAGVYIVQVFGQENSVHKIIKR